MENDGRKHIVELALSSDLINDNEDDTTDITDCHYEYLKQHYSGHVMRYNTMQ